MTATGSAVRSGLTPKTPPLPPSRRGGFLINMHPAWRLWGLAVALSVPRDEDVTGCGFAQARQQCRIDQAAALRHQ